VSPGGIHDINSAADDLGEQIQREIASPDDRRVLTALIACVRGTLRTNLFISDRYALSLRLDPKLLSRPDREKAPFGVFFVHGRDFDGFHVRFRDLSRGAMRIVIPRSREQFALESERIYSEAYSSALLQQLKNKDIPEGGSTGVILISKPAMAESCGRAYADALLDLLSADSEVRSLVVDHYGHEELLYLGPGENVVQELLTWIADRATQRRYPQPNAFMSGKPGPSVAHKTYGVTSEGVTVFLEAALRHIGIDPRERPFTLKLTGGPDGDVAGNEIRILHREFGENAQIVGIADGSGTAEDPKGLDHDELLRLCEAGEPISCFRRELLGPRGRVETVDSRDGQVARNTMHNRVVADAFVPAGGRPRTINRDNWREYLDAEGRPTSRVIIEGANQFVTNSAREGLSQAGVVIIKDSSANKCGEICTSFEILASMLLSEGEFLAIKELFIRQVIIRLRELAALEAAALFREHRHQPDSSLPVLSDRLSNVIDYANDAIAEGIGHASEEQRRDLELLVYEYVPAVLTERAGDTLFERLSTQYTQRVISTVLASRIVYREGMSYLDKMSSGQIAELAFRYFSAEQQMVNLVAELSGSEIPERNRIMEILREAGPTVAMRRLI
jgi:glutamate dehydrogenase